ncbi:MAG: hypothetical protein FWF22_07580 [Treponema sp.]|nr:hypothetical protein [Treponema sp.]
MDYGITCLVKEKEAYYSIQWSPLAIADRWTINSKVPAVAGVYEIYWMDEYGKLRMLSVGNTHYGGLRSELRRLTDSELVTDEKARLILEEKEIWFRYAPAKTASAMADIVWFFRKTYFPEDPGVEPSGLYEKIFLKESAPDKLIWVP